MNLLRLERHNLYQMYETFKTKFGGDNNSYKLEFKSLFDFPAILSPFQLREVFATFWNFQKCFDKIEEQRKKNFLEKYDFIYCSIFDRVLNFGNPFTRF